MHVNLCTFIFDFMKIEDNLLAKPCSIIFSTIDKLFSITYSYKFEVFRKFVLFFVPCHLKDMLQQISFYKQNLS